MVVSLGGHTDIQAHLAKCCSPQADDQVQAYITKDHGATIHKVNCKNFIKVQQKWPQKVAEATWKKI